MVVVRIEVGGADAPRRATVRVLTMCLAALALAGCANLSYVSPNDPEYGRSGAPHAGEAPLQPNNLYNHIQGGDSSGDV